MPGVVGILTRAPRALVEPQLRQMVDVLRHEPFYETGLWVDEALGVYVGWVARKGSFAAPMPLRNERGDLVLVFAGEEFPPPRTPHDLRRRGHDLDVEGPSYLVHLAEEDPSFPARLNGRFHGLLVDRVGGTATLFNDRYGMQRVYHHQARDAFYFAPEAKALLAVRPGLRALDLTSLGEVVACGCALGHRTLFEGVHLLAPGSAWVFRSGALETRRTYFHPRAWEEQTVLEASAYDAELREVFARTLPRYVEAPEPLGMSLTGGLDTRMMMAWHRPRPGSLPCYTFGGAFRDGQDVVVAREVARACQQPHQVIRVDDEFLSAFAHYAERTVFLADGGLDVSHAADLYVNERAREIAPVRLTGNYGGEILRGVRAFKPARPRPGLFDPEVDARVEAAHRTFDALLEEPVLSFIACRQAPWHHASLLGLEETQVSMRSPYLDNDLVRTAYRAPALGPASRRVCQRLIAEGNPVLARIRTDGGLVPGRPGVGAALRRGVLEGLRKAEYAYDYGMPQWMVRLDRAVSALRPERLFLGRHKFTHFRVWYRDALAGYVRQVLLDPRALARPYVRRQAVEAVVRGHLEGRRNHTREIHTLLTLELLHRRFLDG